MLKWNKIEDGFYPDKGRRIVFEGDIPAIGYFDGKHFHIKTGYINDVIENVTHWYYYESPEII